MTEGAEEGQSGDEPGAEKSNESDDQGGGSINDPLTRRDVEAPRAPFETSPTADD
jgi:hypothetical protein